MPPGRRRSTLIVSLLAATTALAGTALPATAGAPGAPSLKLVAPDPTPTIYRYGRGSVALDPGVLLGAVRGDFAVYAFRRDYDHGIEVWHKTGSTMRRLPDDVADGLNGLDRFVRVQLWDSDGDLLVDRKRDFCPASQDVRIDASGPMEATYPRSCWAGPFMLGMVWGIDRGWALNPLGWTAPRFNGPNGRYTLRISIPRRYRELFGVSREAGAVKLEVRIKSDDGCSKCPFRHDGTKPGRDVQPGSIDQSWDARLRGPLGHSPDLQTPPADTVPDLRALPAWSIGLSSRRSREQIQFAATVWNAGPATMLVEGFRRDQEPFMDAYQYFMRDGEAIGRARVGRMEYHAGGHNHWHFLQFARYSLWDASLERMVVSKKQAFCLVPTDAIDLTVEGADWRPGGDGLGTACGSYDPQAIWMRETLQAGWGDTYYQAGGTSLDVTGLPNGIYFIAVEANPDGLLYETDKTNNVELRKIRLGGVPGARTLKVFDFHGIDA